MKSNTLRNLVIVAIALSGLAWFAAQRDRSGFEPQELGLFAPALESRLPEITKVELHTAGKDAFTLEEATANYWVAPAKASYGIDLSQLRKTLRALATAKVVEVKTANPAWHEKLKLQDIADAADTTVEITAYAGDEPVIAVLLGRTGQGGQYIRRVGEDQTWLIDKVLHPGATPSDWLDKSLVNIKRADLRSAEVTPVEGDSWSLQRLGDDTTDFVLKPAAPEGRERNGANSNRLLSGLSNLRLLDVRNANEADADAAWHQVTFQRFDGLSVTAKVRQDGSKYWLQLAASRGEPTPVEEGKPPHDLAAADKLVSDIEARAKGRTFDISSYPAIGLMLAYEKMLKDPPSADNPS